VQVPQEVVGYHGTSREAVPHLIAGDIVLSDQRHEWLGTGFYLWQDSPWRAQEWAIEHHGDGAAVVAVRASIEGCLDLLDPHWQHLLADAADEFVLECLASGVDLPVNRPTGNRARDCATINWFCERAAEEGLPVPSVRAIFEEGEPIFEGSLILTRSHVQVAIRDLSVILEIEEATW
jgi:hypothetical protein